MGFRSVMITEDTALTIPQWFVDKWQDELNLTTHTKDEVRYSNLPISSKFERKFYADKKEELFIDLQQLLKETREPHINDIEIVLFHECAGITKVHIGEDFIRMYEPQGWHEVEGVTHNYCYGCSTPGEG